MEAASELCASAACRVRIGELTLYHAVFVRGRSHLTDIPRHCHDQFPFRRWISLMNPPAQWIDIEPTTYQPRFQRAVRDRTNLHTSPLSRNFPIWKTTSMGGDSSRNEKCPLPFSFLMFLWWDWTLTVPPE